MTDISSLFDQLDAFTIPPVAEWHPDKSVDIDIRIASNGKWFYQESPIERHRIAKLFSTVLRLEGDEYYLVTPPVKYRITVDEVPFVAVEMKLEGRDQGRDIYFRTDMDEVVRLDKNHTLTVVTDTDTQEPSPYILIRDGLMAKIVRSVYYELVEYLEPDPAGLMSDETLGLFSAGQFFPFATISKV